MTPTSRSSVSSLVSLASWFSLAGSFLGGFVVDRPRMVSNPAPLPSDSLCEAGLLDCANDHFDFSIDFFVII